MYVLTWMPRMADQFNWWSSIVRIHLIPYTHSPCKLHFFICKTWSIGQTFSPLLRVWWTTIGRKQYILTYAPPHL